MRMFKTITALLLCLITAAALFGCTVGTDDDKAVQPTEEEKPNYAFATKRKVIIDTDTGADDSSALILAAKAAKKSTH